MKRMTLLSFGVTVVAIGTGFAQTGADRMGSDNGFITKAAQGGMAEVQLGNLAQQKGSNDAVKQFGRQMVTDHTKANEKLAVIASKKGVTMPTEVDAKSKAVMDKLSALSGAAFDRAYMDDMVKDHKEDIAEFQKESKSGMDADVKDFATQTLPTLQHHLEMAQAADSQVKK